MADDWDVPGSQESADEVQKGKGTGKQKGVKKTAGAGKKEKTKCFLISCDEPTKANSKYCQRDTKLVAAIEYQSQKKGEMATFNPRENSRHDKRQRKSGQRQQAQ